MTQRAQSGVSIIEEHIQIPLGGDQFATLVRLYPTHVQGPAVFMLHGLMEDAQCFHNAQMRSGLAYVLARAGYDVYMGELRGRGQMGRAHKQHPLTLNKVLSEDLPRLVDAMAKRAHQRPQFWLGQGLGSLLMVSLLAREPERLNEIVGMIHFSPVSGLRQNCEMGPQPLHWSHRYWLKPLASILGFVPAQRFKLGHSNESTVFYLDVLRWLYEKWEGPEGEALDALVSAQQWPPMLYFATYHRHWRNSVADARALMFALGDHNGRLVKLGRHVGNQRTYKRQELCLHEDAEQDYYPLLLSWMGDVVNDAYGLQAQA
ncbi:hypothetical protein BFW38_05510 [Terasakiispira papahanaumokuakeensis]|uniref:Serine aminopeptidase S33 domain-containing protein n=1 Tax=Terasakiispira papahanaumokuakeensis TaxID=197479 RepID=A0A1E2V8U9_9GAMM|nr:alpha/beta fold hydrolase [Terasakiispira papahanaumokuakeensis]ODC03085.1 hypothetical protein BFW38_05510 [Terasakiispira papahanaumokuakeensis]